MHNDNMPGQNYKGTAKVKESIRHDHTQGRQCMRRAGSRVAAGQADGPTWGGKLSAWLTCTCVGSYARTQPRAVQAASLGSARWGCQRDDPPNAGSQPAGCVTRTRMPAGH